MSWLVFPGIALVIAGIAALVYCITKAARLKNDEQTSEDDKRKALQGLIAVNLAGVALSAFGLILTTMGIIF